MLSLCEVMMNHKHRKTVVITGGTKGIGREIALKLAQQQHYNIVLNYHQDDNAAYEARKACEEKQANVLLVKADVSKKTEVASLMQACMEAFHALDVLVNNAGTNIDKPLQ